MVEVVDVDVVVVTVVVDDVLDTLVGSVGTIVVVELLVIETTLNIAVRVLLPVSLIVGGQAPQPHSCNANSCVKLG